MTMTIVTGTRGLLGSHLLPMLQSEGEVFAIDRDRLDLSQPIDASALPGTADTIVYLAQSNRYREFPDGAPDMFQINTAQVAALLAYGVRAGVKNFVYASTGSVYGTVAGTVREDSPTPPPGQMLGFYPASKLAAEHLAGAYGQHMTVAVLRYFFIYGPGQKPLMMIPRLIESVREGRPLQLQGPDGLRINPVHARDAARATAAAANLGTSTTINVAGPEALSMRDIGEAIGIALGKEPKFKVDPSAKANDLIADTSRMQSLLAAPSVRFAAALPELIASMGR